MRRWRSPMLCTALVLVLTLASVTAFASHTTEAPTFAGCLDTAAGTIGKLKKGYVPLSSCETGEIRVHLSGGDITSVFPTSGGGLTGGAEDGNAQLAIDFKTTDARWVNEGQPGSVTGRMIQVGSVTSADIRNDTVQSADIRDNTVASSDIADGTISNIDVADGTLSTGKLDPSVSFGRSNAISLFPGAETAAVSVVYASPSAANQFVLITGQVSVSCTCNAGDEIALSWYVRDDTVFIALTPTYADVISGNGGNPDRTIVATVNSGVSLTPGIHELSLVFFPTVASGSPAAPVADVAELTVVGLGVDH